jgi:hypothetical protein
VQFTSTQTLTSPSGGQARIESVPTGILNNLVTTIPGFFFEEAVFNLDASANGIASITALDQFGAAFNLHSPDGRTELRNCHADSDIGIRTLCWIERGGDGEPGG